MTRVLSGGAVDTTRRSLITGATGLLGSHIAESLVARGERVRALVRPTSDTAFLTQLGVELVTGDLHDPDAIRRAVAGVGVVYHSAAHVGDWGKWPLFQREVIDATRNVLDACGPAGVGRLVYVSSVAAYGHPGRTGAPITEDDPLGQKLYRFRDYYSRAKIAAEELVRAAGPLAAVVRPSWIVGPRDRTSLAPLFAAIRRGMVSIVGRGDNFVNIVAAADVADGAIRAGTAPAAAGGVFNLCSEGEITQREFFATLTAAIGRKPIRRRVPHWMAYSAGVLGEVVGTAIGIKRSPYVTRHSVSLISRPTRFSIARAREQLGWEPRVGAREGLRRALAWWAEKQAAAGGK